MSLFDIKSLCSRVFNSSKASPKDFADLLQALFSATVLAPGEALVITQSNDIALVGTRLSKPVLRLNNGHYLKFFMEYELSAIAPLSIKNSAFQYQLDQVRMSKQFVFRYD